MQLSSEVAYKKKTENIFNNNKNSIEGTSVLNKLKSFIKAKPILFTLIVVGSLAIVTTAIAVPVALATKNKEDSKDDIIINKSQDDDSEEIYNNIVYINNKKDFDFSSSSNKIEASYNNIGDNANSLDNFCTYLNGIASTLDEQDKVYFIYKWVAKNIEYDYENYKLGKSSDCIPANVLTKKKTVCSGYAKLFSHLLKCLYYDETKIINIMGHSKGLSYNVNKEIKDEETEHEWNAVIIGNKGCLIDTTWGAGGISNDAFKPSYTEYYLCTPPSQFVRKHLPIQSEKQYQFLENPIDINTFKNMALTQNDFFEYGFVGLAYDQAIQNICGDGSLILKYDTNIKPYLSIHLRKGNTNYDNWFMQNIITNGYKINFYINEAGEYDLQIYANHDPSTSFPFIISFKIKCDSSPIEKKYFPNLYLYDLYNIAPNDFNINFELISPIANELIKGNKYNFKIKSSSYDKLYIFNNYEYIEMKKEGMYLIKNEVLIDGSFVYIYLKKGERYYLILSYPVSS